MHNDGDFFGPDVSAMVRKNHKHGQSLQPEFFYVCLDHGTLDLQSGLQKPKESMSTFLINLVKENFWEFVMNSMHSIKVFIF